MVNHEIEPQPQHFIDHIIADLVLYESDPQKAVMFIQALQLFKARGTRGVYFEDLEKLHEDQQSEYLGIAVRKLVRRLRNRLEYYGYGIAQHHDDENNRIYEIIALHRS